MTLILTLGNTDQIVQVSDRRLTINGRPDEDESSKAGVFVCSNARLAFGFAGLAKYDSFITLRWLLENLVHLGPPNFQAGSILERLKAKATEDFKNLQVLVNVPLEHKRLSVIFAGYLYHYSPPRGAYAILSNFQDCVRGRDASRAWDSFKFTVFNETIPRTQNPAFIRPIGAWSAMRESDLTPLKTLLIQRKPARAIVDKAVETIRDIADRPQAAGTIGKQLSSIILPRDLNVSPIAEYHTMVPKPVMYFPAVATSIPGKQIAIADPEYGSPEETNARPIVFPKVGRNKPCPCGSGKKYKKCHGSFHVPSDRNLNLLS